MLRLPIHILAVTICTTNVIGQRHLTNYFLAASSSGNWRIKSINATCVLWHVPSISSFYTYDIRHANKKVKVSPSCNGANFMPKVDLKRLRKDIGDGMMERTEG